MGVLVSVFAASAFAAGQLTREEAVDASESFLRSYAQVRSNKNAEELTANLFYISKTWFKKRNLDPTKTKVNGRRIDSIELIRWSPPKAYFIGFVNDNTPFAKLVFEVRREDDEIIIVPEKISPENREWIEPYSYVVLTEAERSNDKDFIAYKNRISNVQNLKQTNESQQRQSANACNAYYQGKSVGFKPAGFSYFGSVLDAVVLGKGNGNVSIKIVDRNFTDLYGKTLEMSCTSDQLQ